MINSICIVRLSALGDVLMLVPLVRTLQHAFPQATITWVISRPAYDLVEGMEGVEFIEINKPNTIIDYWQFYKRLQKRTFDVLLATQACFRANLLYPLIKATRKIGYDALRAKDGHGLFIRERITPGNDHTLEGFLKFAQALGISDHQFQWHLPIPEADYEWARQHIDAANHRPIVLINPAASKPERSWLVDRYIEIIKHLKNKWRAHIILTGGPGQYDKTLADAIIQAVPVSSLVGKTKPKQLLALIQHADLLICPDTGPSHMAAAVETPVIALHAVTSARVSGPYTYKHLAIDYYAKAVESVLKKSPETIPWGTHAHGAETMSLIPAHVVKEHINHVLKDLGFD